MRLSESAHVDTFCRDNLPPDGQWPDFRFSLPGLHYPARLNAAVALLDATADAFGGGRPCLLSEDRSWSYDDVVRILEDEGVSKFAVSWNEMLETIRTELSAK